MDELTRIRDQARIDADRIVSSVERLAPTITADSLHRFATAARRKLRDRECGYRRDHLRALTQRVEVVSKTEARIIGSRTDLLRVLASSDGGDFAAAGGVLGFKPKWRAPMDSNSYLNRLKMPGFGSDQDATHCSDLFRGRASVTSSEGRRKPLQLLADGVRDLLTADSSDVETRAC